MTPERQRQDIPTEDRRDELYTSAAVAKMPWFRYDASGPQPLEEKP